MPHQPQRDPYREFSRVEAILAALLFGSAGAGAIGQLRKIPPRLGVLVKRRDAESLLNSNWWRSTWLRFKNGHRTAGGNVVAGIVTRLVRLSRASSSAAIRELGARVTGRISTRLAERQARAFALALANQTKADTAAGLVAALDDIKGRGVSSAELRRRLEARLGPTVAQLAEIRRLEIRDLGRGMTPDQAQRAVKRRALAGVRLRSSIMAESALVRQVSESRIAVFAEAGVLISSGNPLDQSTRDLHRRQTEVTRANPLPAGGASLWVPAAPFPGPPGYEIRCRCWIESATPAAEPVAGVQRAAISLTRRNYSSRKIDFTDQLGHGKTTLSFTEIAAFGPNKGRKKRIRGSLTQSGLNERLASLRARFKEDFGIDPEIEIELDAQKFETKHRQSQPRGVRYEGAPSAYAQDGKVFIGPDFKWEIISADAESSAQIYRTITHEMMHVRSGLKSQRLGGLEPIFEEGAIEVTSMDWTRKAMGKNWMDAWKDRIVTDSGTVGTSGVETMIRRSVYRDRISEVILQSARRVGWDKEAILDDIAGFLRSGDARTQFFTRADGTLERLGGESLRASSRELRENLLREAVESGIDLEALAVDSQAYLDFSTGAINTTLRDEDQLVLNLLNWLFS